MANTILTPTAVTREALMILHQKLNFIGSINRQYDSQYAKAGAKIGNDLKIRLPNEYTVRTGRAIDLQNTSETSTTLTVATQKGVDIEFTSEELTMDLDDFSDRILKPAMSVLAANIEDDALSMYKDVYNEVSDVGDSLGLADVLNARKVQRQNLAPMDDCYLLLSNQQNVDLVTASQGLFNNQKEVGKQYTEGYVGRLHGYDVMENSLMPIHTTGSEAGDDTGADIDGANQTGSSVTVDGTVTGTFKKGDIVEFAGCNAVHPETKADLGFRKQFVVTEDVSASYSSIPISPAIVTSGGRQNVSASPTDNGIVYKVEGDHTTAIAGSADYEIGLAYHKDAFAFASADLVMPDGVDWSAREVMDGISMRIVRQYDINNDNFPCRLDVLYGYKAIRPQLAVRLGTN